jgi:hypothetical protein
MDKTITPTVGQTVGFWHWAGDGIGVYQGLSEGGYVLVENKGEVNHLYPGHVCFFNVEDWVNRRAGLPDFSGLASQLEKALGE